VAGCGREIGRLSARRWSLLLGCGPLRGERPGQAGTGESRQAPTRESDGTLYRGAAGVLARICIALRGYGLPAESRSWPHSAGRRRPGVFDFWRAASPRWDGGMGSSDSGPDPRDLELDSECRIRRAKPRPIVTKYR
jgi:hypothetical protein